MPARSVATRNSLQRRAVWEDARRRILRHWQLYLLILPPVLYILIFRYFPMYGLQLAFKEYNYRLGYWGSPGVGLKHFVLFFKLVNQA